MKYAELSCKTHYSFLRGASHPHELVERALELGISALAITDLNGVYGVPKAYLAAKTFPQLKLLIGAELEFHDHPNISFICQNRSAYGLLCRLITRLHEDVEKGEGKLYFRTLEEMISLPGGSGLMAFPRVDPKTRFSELKEQFQDRLYLPLGQFLDGVDHLRREQAMLIEKKHQIPIVASNDVLYHSKSKRPLQDTLTCIREGVTLKDASSLLYSNSERYLKSASQMSCIFKEIPNAVLRTVEVSDRCQFDLSELRYRYPSEWIPKGMGADEYLRSLTLEGARSRYPRGVPRKVQIQIERELTLVQELGFADYFLTVWEIVEFAKQKNILCQGRGSAANSAICYCLGITSVDPIQMNLLFERFISSERGEPPDIDVDFEHERREEVVQYIYQKYGRDRAAMVAAVVTYRSRGAIREISKALGCEINRDEWKRICENPPQGQEFFLSQLNGLVDEVKGFPRHLSIHSGGFTLSADPIIETVPVEPARMEGRTIVQWDKYDLDALGLLKIDVLCLGILSAIHKTFDLVGGLTLASVPKEDRLTYEMIQKADTIGTFQIESRAQMNMLGRLQPENFYDLVIQVAIVRPGPIMGQMVHPYLKRRRGLEPIDYPHSKLTEILGKTLGVPLFQEQVMKMAIELAGFSPGDSDQLRRAIGAWRSSGSIQKVGARLMDGLRESGLPQDFVDRIFEQIKGFSEYGFPESHAASFALLAYISCYLKCHHPVEYTSSLINSQPMGFYSNHTLVDDLKRHGYEVLPVHPNDSEWDCRVVDGKLLMGFRVVHGLRESDTNSLLSERRENGKYRSLLDFLKRAPLKRNIFLRLAMGDVFSYFGVDRREALWQVLGYQLMHERISASNEQLQFNFPLPDIGIKQFSSHSSYERMRLDYRVFGLSTRGHPMGVLRNRIKRLPRLCSITAKQMKAGEFVSLSGLVICRQHPRTAQGTIFATLEDENGFCDLIIREQTFKKYEFLFLSESFLTIQGTLHKDRDSSSILVRSIRSVWSKESNQEIDIRIQSRDFR